MFQESKELPVTELVGIGQYHQLAEWMREGAKRTKQCRDMNFVCDEIEGQVAVVVVVETCAIAAAALASGYDLIRSGVSTWAMNHVPFVIQQRIIRLNDDHGWTREQIADWLCREGGCGHVL